MAKARGTKPKLGATPETEKQVRTAVDPESYDKETIVWRFSAVDLDGEWGWRTAAGARWWRAILPKLQDFETMTWAEIQSASGGRSNGSNSHTVEVRKCTTRAKKRLQEIKQNDVSEIFSLRLSGTERIYGIRDRRALKLLWYDRHHGNNAVAVYATKKKGT